MALADHSGTITTTHTSQKIYTAGDAATSIRFLNTSGATLWVNTGAAAGPGNGSYRLHPDEGADETWLPLDADIYVYGEATANYTLKHD